MLAIEGIQIRFAQVDSYECSSKLLLAAHAYGLGKRLLTREASTEFTGWTGESFADRFVISADATQELVHHDIIELYEKFLCTVTRLMMT